MPEFPLIVSYYTQDTLYQLEVQNLIASCEKWGLDHHIEPVPSLGSWERNCCYKPFFIMEKLQQLQKPLFWVDADAVFLQKPEWLDVFTKDLAVRINATWDETHSSKVMTGSLFVNATPGAAHILKSWAQECIDFFSDPYRTEEVWDQIALRNVIARGVKNAEVGALPSTYAAIADNPCDQQEIAAAVIAHYQASRRFKKIINDAGRFDL